MIEVDVWLRGNNHATTSPIPSVPSDANTWTDVEVEQLLTEMLVALDREKNPDGERPDVSLRGFSWIVSPDQVKGVLLHLEMQLGTASAGPFNLTEPVLTAMIARVIASSRTSASVH